MNRLVIIGAGGHGKVVADNALKNGYTDIIFLDDHASDMCMGFPILGTCDRIKDFDDGTTDYVIAVGNNGFRKQIASAFDVNWATLIHPSAVIARNVYVGRGTVVMAGAIINACATIGDHSIINTAAIVEHDNVIEDFVHISPNAALGGTVRVGERTHIGIGATVINNLDICAACTIGAGAVVVKSIKEVGTYTGIPAKKMT